MADAHPSAAIIPDLYRRHARDWLEQRGHGPLFEQAWLDRFRAIISPCPHLLDLGCGSGRPIADYLIACGAVVTGVDASGPLLDDARRRHRAPHQWIEGDMRTLGLDRTFDGIIAWHSLFHLPPADQPALFPAFARLLRPGGALMFTSGLEHGEVIGQWQGEPLYHGSLSASEYADALDKAGFEIEATAFGDETCGNANIWLARRR